MHFELMRLREKQAAFFEKRTNCMSRGCTTRPTHWVLDRWGTVYGCACSYHAREKHAENMEISPINKPTEQNNEEN